MGYTLLILSIAISYFLIKWALRNDKIEAFKELYEDNELNEDFVRLFTDNNRSNNS